MGVKFYFSIAIFPGHGPVHPLGLRRTGMMMYSPAALPAAKPWDLN